MARTACRPTPVPVRSAPTSPFADAGTKDALVDTLRGLRNEGEAVRHQLGAQAADYVATGGPFPERLHIIALIGRFLGDYAQLLESWAAWAEEQVTHWPAAGPASAVPIAHEVFHELIERAGSSP